jgi:lysophospholipase L1-like esterase
LSSTRSAFALLALATACVTAPPVPVRRTLVCAGDSNSIPTASWCELLAGRLAPSDWYVVNASIWGTGARGWATKGTVARLVAPHRPDVVLFALGTNDVCEARPEIVVDALLTLAGQASSACEPGAAPCPRIILATIPPTHLPPPLDGCRLATERTNELLRAAWPSHLLADFDGWVSGPEWYGPDGVHFNADGQARRADAALDALLAAVP